MEFIESSWGDSGSRHEISRDGVEIPKRALQSEWREPEKAHQVTSIEESLKLDRGRVQLPEEPMLFVFQRERETELM